jgi:hypothetical protein
VGARLLPTPELSHIYGKRRAHIHCFGTSISTLPGRTFPTQDESSKHSNCKDPDYHVYLVHSLFSQAHSSVSMNIVFHYMSFVIHQFHFQCSWYQRCRPVCRYIRTEILKTLRKLGWKVSDKLDLLRHRFSHHLDIDIALPQGEFFSLCCTREQTYR